MKTSNLRNPIDRSPLRSGLLFIALALGYFALSPAPNAFGVVPAPDGGYPGFNTAEGQNALLHLTTGTGNTAVGWFSLENVTTASFNTGVGAGTLVLNSGDQNTATGAAALLLNTTGSFNTANGALALLNNSEGIYNTASGANALYSYTTGVRNTANGYGALFSNTTGNRNTANGVDALFHNTEGADNTANGFQALVSNTTGSFNTANGTEALHSNTTGLYSTAIGYRALFSNNSASNTAVGAFALSNNTGGGNIALGAGAGNLTTGDSNIDIGNFGVAGDHDTIRIGDIQTKTFIAGIRGVTTVNTAIPVLIDTAGQLGTMSSSRRFKNEIKPMDQTSEAILGLKPVTFHYNSDSTGTPQFGLIAEEVEKVNPDLVVRDKNGEIYTVRYDAVNAKLLNEFLKEHRTVEAQQKEIDALKAELKEQRALIQQVNDKVELNRPAPQTVANDQ
jgi:hypothetical protein